MAIFTNSQGFRIRHRLARINSHSSTTTPTPTPGSTTLNDIEWKARIRAGEEWMTRKRITCQKQEALTQKTIIKTKNDLNTNKKGSKKT